MGASTSSKVDCPYGATTDAINVARDFRQQCENKRIIITGANSGLGLETARVLSLNGAEVIICSRNPKNGESAVNKIKAENPAAKVTSMALDLASLRSINKFVEEIKDMKKPIHVLINNAGIMGCPFATTEDGFESQIGTNHLGHFHLTNLLLPILSNCGTKEVPARIVNLSSLANYVFPPAQGIDFDNMDGKKYYDAYVRYGESKLANILFTRELQKRLESEDKNVIAVSLHPGVILGTNLIRHLSVSIAWNATWSMVSSGNYGSLSALIREPQKTIPQGSATTVRAALDPKIVPGEHYADCNVSDLVHPEGLNPILQKKLWEVSEALIKEALLKLE